MFAPLSESNRSQLDPDFLDGFEEDDDLCELQGSFRDLSLSCDMDFGQVHKFIKDRLVFFSSSSPNDASMTVYCDAPPHHEYSVQMIFTVLPTDAEVARAIADGQKLKPPTGKKIQVAGTTAESTASIINGLVEAFMMDHKTSTSFVEIAFKCFATTPRKPLGKLDIVSLPNLQSEANLSLSFQFVTLTSNHFERIFQSVGVSKVEFRQCTLTEVDTLSTTNAASDQGLKRIVFSCGLSELPAFTKLLSPTRLPASVKTVDILMHFLVDKPLLESLMTTLKENTNIEKLRIEYLELDDDAWALICTLLAGHPSIRHIDLAFTEKFADNIRRLTPERRTQRSEAVLELVKSSPNLLHMDWPKFQQDEEIEAETKQLLESRN